MTIVILLIIGVFLLVLKSVILLGPIADYLLIGDGILLVLSIIDKINNNNHHYSSGSQGPYDHEGGEGSS